MAKYVGAAIGLIVLALGGWATIVGGGQPPAQAPVVSFHLEGAEPSIDALLDKFRAALEAKDKALLRSLRVNQREYLGVILPGSVDEGAPRASYNEQAQKYFWSILDTKSIYSEAGLLSSYGGRPLKLTNVEYRKGIKKYRDYTAYKQLTLTFDDGSPDPEHVRLGSIAEVDGQYKFISFVRD